MQSSEKHKTFLNFARLQGICKNVNLQLAAIPPMYLWGIKRLHAALLRYFNLIHIYDLLILLS